MIILKHPFLTLFFTLLFTLLFACGADNTEEDIESPDDTPMDFELPEVFNVFPSNVQVYTETTGGINYIVIETDNIPNHSSPYFAESNESYEAYTGDNPDFNLNPNRIAEQNITLRIPADPEEATNKEATPLGTMGVSRNGVVFFNQYAGPNNQPLTFEINSFVQYLGHPQQQGTYHYHQEPLFITQTEGQNA